MIKIKDLIYFEGPLLSHFQSVFKENFLFYWVDTNNDFNRWIVFRTSNEHLTKYQNKETTLYQLITNSDNGNLYKVDIDDNLEYHNLSIVELDDLPTSYLPDVNSYYAFTPIQNQDPLKKISETENTGVLQAYYNDTSKVGVGYIDLEILGSSLNDFGKINKGIRKAFLQKEKTSFKNAHGTLKKFNEEEIIKASSFYYFGHTAASFGALFKPFSQQYGLENILSIEDRYIEYLISFFQNSSSKETFTESMKLIDKSVIDTYKKLLSTIKKSKIQFNINYQNTVSDFSISKDISYSEAGNILNIIDDLEFDNSRDLYLTGRFTALNLKTGHYNFETINKEEDSIETSSGYLDQERKEFSWQINWNKLYNVVITRKESKKTGRKKLDISDTLVSFVKIDDPLDLPKLGA